MTEAKAGDMEVTWRMTTGQARAFAVGMILCGALLFAIGFAVGVFSTGMGWVI